MLVAFAAFVLFGGLLLVGCEDKDPLDADGIAGPSKSPVENEPPETYLSLNFPPGELPDTSRSSKTLNWWGEDIDGRVVGYEYRWGQVIFEDTTTIADSTGLEPIDTLWYNGDFAFVGDDEVWVSTAYEEVKFVLPIRSVSATFTMQVRALDNDGAIDPTPAEIAFPIINSKPEIEFRDGSNPGASDPDTTVVDSVYTFPVRTFVWDASDPDGNESIDKILYALDPLPGDTSWEELAGNESSVTLSDLTPGAHSIVVKVVDVAGFESPPIIYPDPAKKDTDPDYWIVKAPAPGGFLIVDDYALQSQNGTLNYYKAILDSLYNDGTDGEDDVYSVWELEELPYATTDITRSLLMFDKVLWYSFRGTPLLTDAFASMYSFINTEGNRLLLTTSVVDSGEVGVHQGMLLDIADGVEFVSGRFGTLSDDPVYLDPVDVPSLPQLYIGGLINYNTWGLIPAAGSEILYRLDESTHEPPQYEGTPVVGLRRADKSYTLITIPLDLTSDRQKVGELIRNTFAE
ncbi:hypothetical protein KQI52_04035 [bacterium]|nr:hypothetical protein [bacterium]